MGATFNSSIGLGVPLFSNFPIRWPGLCFAVLGLMGGGCGAIREGVGGLIRMRVLFLSQHKTKRPFNSETEIETGQVYGK